MLIQHTILVWDAWNLQNTPKAGFQNVDDMYSGSYKNQTKSDKDLQYGLKWLPGCLIIDLGGQHAYSTQNFRLGGL